MQKIINNNDKLIAKSQLCYKNWQYSKFLYHLYQIFIVFQARGQTFCTIINTRGKIFLCIGKIFIAYEITFPTSLNSSKSDSALSRKVPVILQKWNWIEKSRKIYGNS